VTQFEQGTNQPPAHISGATRDEDARHTAAR